MEIMRKAICIAVACCCLNGTTDAQNVVLNMNNVTVKQAIDELKEQSGYSFVFSSQDLDTRKRVSVSVDNGDVSDAVRQIIDGQEVTYEINGKNIIIRKIAPQQNTPVGQTKTITGTVIDPQGEPVIGANIIVKGTTNGTITDIDGKFSLQAPSNALVVISYTGLPPRERLFLMAVP